MKKLLYFHAHWCKPCIFVAKEYLSKVEASCPEQIEKIDAQIEPHIAEMYMVDKLPTILILEGEV